MRLLVTALAPALLCGLAAACTPRARGGLASDEYAEPHFKEVTLHVRNANFYDATIYAVSGDSRQRLGNVTGNNTAVFRFTWQMASMYFVIDLLAVGSYTTDEINVTPGDELDLLVDPNLHRRPPGSRAGPG